MVYLCKITTLFLDTLHFISPPIVILKMISWQTIGIQIVKKSKFILTKIVAGVMNSQQTLQKIFGENPSIHFMSRANVLKPGK